MNSFRQISDNIKIKLKKNQYDLVYDKNVAYELGIDQFTFSTNLRRNSINYKKIMIWCVKNKVDIKTLFFEKISYSKEG